MSGELVFLPDTVYKATELTWTELIWTAIC